MKLNESFGGNYDENLPTDPENLLLSSRIKSFLNNVGETLSGLDKETFKLVRAILNKKQLKEINTELNDKYNELSEQSEKLIESENSNSPEIRKKRAEIAKELNQILETQEELEPLLINLEESEIIISMASQEEKDKAEKISDNLLNNLDSVIKPKTNLN